MKQKIANNKYYDPLVKIVFSAWCRIFTKARLKRVKIFKKI